MRSADLRTRFPIATRSVLDHRRSTAAWALGIGAYVGVVIAAWPSIHRSTAMAEAVNQYPEAMKELFGGAAGFDMSTGSGYLNVEFFSLMAPLLLLVFAIGLGSSTTAGEEAGGQLDLVLALPMSRRRVMLEKIGALIISALVPTVVMAMVIAAANSVADLGVPLSGLLAATTGAALVAVLHGTLALAVGAGTGRRAVAIGTSTGLFVAGYLAQALAGLVPAVKSARVLSVMYHANGSTPVRNGFPVAHFLLLVGLTGVCAAAAVAGFERRDVRG